MKETISTIASASPNDFTNSAIECSTTCGWSAIWSTVMPDRQLGADLLHRRLQRLRRAR